MRPAPEMSQLSVSKSKFNPNMSLNLKEKKR